MREKVVINENGKRKTVTKLEAMSKQLVNSAATGNLRAIQSALPLARSVEEQPEQSDQRAELVEGDQKVWKSFLRRLNKKRPRERENESNNH